MWVPKTATSALDLSRASARGRGLFTVIFCTHPLEPKVHREGALTSCLLSRVLRSSRSCVLSFLHCAGKVGFCLPSALTSAWLCPGPLVLHCPRLSHLKAGSGACTEQLLRQAGCLDSVQQVPWAPGAGRRACSHLSVSLPFPLSPD